MAAAAGEPDAFDAIVMAEARFHGEGYQDGYAEGVHAGVMEGRQYGVQQGAGIGSEIGSYLGFAVTWQQLLQKTSDEKYSKKIKILELLTEMIQNFPLEDPAYDKLQDDLEKIRGRFKQQREKKIAAGYKKAVKSYTEEKRKLIKTVIQNHKRK